MRQASLLIIKGTTAAMATLRKILTNHRVRLHRQTRKGLCQRLHKQGFPIVQGTLSKHRVRQLYKKRMEIKRLRLLNEKGVTAMKQRIMTNHRLSQLINKQG